MGDIDKIIQEVSPYYKKKKYSSKHVLKYESSSETLEPIYFWILDFMNAIFRGNVTKLADNFASSPGSGHFGELGQKMSVMQQQAMQIMGQVNTVLKSVINILYDLREFQIRLKSYEDAESNDKNTAEAGILALKQIWLDKVDLHQRGNGSINALTSGNLQFVTLRDAFLAANSIKDVDKLDLNERVKRILKPRLEEFEEWKKRSYQELKKRYEIEKTYLRSQVNTLKLYAKWAKPYLKAAQQLENSESLGKKPDLVNIFNTILLEVTLMGQNSVDIESAIISKDLPPGFKNMKLRKYYSIVIVDFNFRGIPSKAGQHYVFGGKAEVTFKSYALNEDELLLFKDKLSQSDLEDSLKLVQGMTDDSLKELNEEIESFLQEEEKEPEKESSSSDTNPFSALFSFLKTNNKPKTDEKNKLKELKEKGIPKEKYAEKYVRSLAEANAINSCYVVYDIYKKSHGMASLPYVKDEEPEVPDSFADRLFGVK